ncbi:MAG: glycine--tRNA ligase [Acidimicrobiia bacterium]|nr:glycine--tRNA ligase [Acidimicrobiia bacterium]MDQ3501426.1 glycine--tRNA ligase [Actinomycetota bacterium]
MPASLDTIAALAKQRGFVFQSSEIYGGIRSAYDYGPLGVLLLRNVKDEWWRAMVQERDDIVGLDSAILQARKVWQASGHESVFTDPLVECRNCNQRFRLDKLDDPSVCPNCGARDNFTEARAFNLMFRTHTGPVEDESNLIYLRPETAQGIFINFDNVRRSNRLKLPFGVAQIGKSFRNEITPGQFVFRTREFEQMEMEYFCRPEDAPAQFDYWVDSRHRWYLDLGMTPENLRIRPHEADELSHYSAATVDVEYNFPWGWDELEGIANRTDFDLRQHTEHSGIDLRYFDEDSKDRFFPYVIEPAAGATRATFAFLIDAYHEDKVKGEARTVVRLHPRLAPYKLAILPLSKKAELIEPAQKLATELRRHFMLEVDLTQSIGKRYRRQDEIGTPFCVTVDFETLEDQAVTIRHRDSTEQDRVAMTRVLDFLSGALL